MHKRLVYESNDKLHLIGMKFGMYEILQVWKKYEDYVI